MTSAGFLCSPWERAVFRKITLTFLGLASVCVLSAAKDIEGTWVLGCLFIGGILHAEHG